MLLVNPSPSLSRWGGGWDIRPGIGGFFGQDFHPPTPKMEVFWWEKGIQEVKTGEFSSKWLRRRWKRSWKQHRRGFSPPQKKLKSGIFGQPGELEDSQDCPRDRVGFWDALCGAWSWNVLRDI